MPDRSEDENHVIELKVSQILTDEMIRLYKEEDETYLAVMELLAKGKGETLVRLYDAMRTDLREALQFARGELQEAEDKFWVSYCNHPGDARIPQEDKDKEMLYVAHAREDKEHLVTWSERAGNAAKEIKVRLANS